MMMIIHSEDLGQIKKPDIVKIRSAPFDCIHYDAKIKSADENVDKSVTVPSSHVQ